ncbi:MAG TPA: DUF169 domain-containing protein [Bacillales bacterium]|nr:DUF169 domain-containing protein [Bacillales bacterium]
MGKQHVSNWNGRETADNLYRLLKLKTIPIGMKWFETAEQMKAVPRIRRPAAKHLLDQVVAQAARLGWTVGITADDLAMKQCGAIAGLMAQEEDWYSGDAMEGVWFENREDSAAHQRALDVVQYGRYEALAVSPLASERLQPPDICLIYATPGQMILLINGLQWNRYEKFEWSVAGESACADSWARALTTGKPSLSLPCYAERRYGGVSDDELLMAIPPVDLQKGIDGLKRLAENGLRYPIPPYGIQADPSEALAPIYPQWVRSEE